jgi:hypothetical protein
MTRLMSNRLVRDTTHTHVHGEKKSFLELKKKCSEINKSRFLFILQRNILLKEKTDNIQGMTNRLLIFSSEQ